MGNTALKTDKIDLNTLGDINRADLFTEVERLAGDYGRISGLLLNAVDTYTQEKTTLEQLEGKLDAHARSQCEITNEKITESKIKAAVRSAQPWIVQKGKLDKADTEVEFYKSALKTLDKKERMLDLLGRFQIKEYGVTSRTQ